MAKKIHEIKKPCRTEDELSTLMNVGPATLGKFHLLGIETIEQLAIQDADQLYQRLHSIIGTRIDPCMHDVFAAAIHQARTGQAFPWWHFTEARKARQLSGSSHK